MRVLWFTNSPSLSADFLNNKSLGAGWISSLEAELSKIDSIQLGVSFHLENSAEKSFKINKTEYFPIPVITPKSELKNIFLRWRNSSNQEELIKSYLNIIDEFKPDVINIFGTENSFGLMIPRTNIPCVIHIQGSLTIVTKRWYSGLTKAEIFKFSKLKPLLKGYGFYHDHLYTKKTAIRERKIFKYCKYFMGRTDWDKRITAVLSPHSAYYHCDEILRPAFYTALWRPQSGLGDYTVITTLRNCTYKGLETIFECAEILNKLQLNHKLKWRIIGISETDEIIYMIEKKYRTTFKENNINMLGGLMEDEIISEMLLADLFVHPSHVDNSPNSLCEAMLIGMPVIASYAGGIPSLVKDKHDGLLFQSGDSYALAGTVLELMKNQEYSKKLGYNARVRGIERQNPEKIIHDLMTIYQSVKYDAT